MDEKPTIPTLIKGIEFKTRQLTDLISELKGENARLKETHDALQKKLTELTIKNNFLEDKISIVKAAKVLKHEDKGDVKSRINELLREIDKCINLLSNNNIVP